MLKRSRSSILYLIALVFIFTVLPFALSGCGGGGGGGGNPVTPPAAPTGLKATAADTQVALTWSLAPGATSYNVYDSVKSGGPYTIVGSASSTTTNFIVKGLIDGTQYYFVVKAVNSAGPSVYSNEANATPTIASTVPTTVPSAPVLTATAGNAYVSLTWKAVTGAAGYDVYYSITPGGGAAGYTAVPLGTSGYVTTSTGYDVTGLTGGGVPVNGTTYYFVVTAVNNVGPSVYSNQAYATPSSSLSATLAPTGLTATAGNAQAVLAWNAVTGATSYNVYQSTTSGSYGASIASPTTTTYTATSLTNGTAYYFVVTAVDSANTPAESAKSNEATATPATPAPLPPAPTGLVATAADSQVALTWNAVAGAASYNVYESTTSGGPYANIASPASASYTATGLTDGTTYYFVVTAVDSAGESAQSIQAYATPATIVSMGTLTTYTQTTGDNTSLIFNLPSNFPTRTTLSYTITANNGNDTVNVNTSGNNTFTFGTGTDTINSLGTGNDTMTIGTSATEYTNFNAVSIHYASSSVAPGGNTITVYGSGNDIINLPADNGDNTITVTGNGNDSVYVNNGTNKITMTNTSSLVTDIVLVGQGANTINLLNTVGTDTISIGQGANTISLGTGADSINLTTLYNTTTQLAGANTLNNVINGDTLVFNRSADTAAPILVASGTTGSSTTQLGAAGTATTVDAEITALQANDTAAGDTSVGWIVIGGNTYIVMDHNTTGSAYADQAIQIAAPSTYILSTTGISINSAGYVSVAL
jgi:fibronectin type 3 domain-containing protein